MSDYPRRVTSRKLITCGILLSILLATNPAIADRSTMERTEPTPFSLVPPPSPPGAVVGVGPPYWMAVPSMHTARQDLAAVLGPDGRIYAIGGSNLQSMSLGSVEAYNPLTQTWTMIPELFSARTALAAATGPDGRIYAIGGYNSPTGGDPRTVQVYAPGQKSWMVGPNFNPGAGDGVAATTGLDGRIYALPLGPGGAAAYDPRTHGWTTLPNLAHETSYLAATTGPDGRIYALGGRDLYSRIGVFATVEAYNPHSRRWTSIPDLPVPRGELAAATGPDGRIYAIGGYDDTGAVSDSVSAYDSHTKKWMPVPSLHTPRGGLAAVQGIDGRIYAIGGYTAEGDYASQQAYGNTPSNFLNTVEAYGPLIQLSPQTVSASGTVVLTGTNFAAGATVTVRWGSGPSSAVLGTGHTDAKGILLHAITFGVPHGLRSGSYVVTAEDDRSHYPVRAWLGVGEPVRLPVTPTPPPSVKQTPLASPTMTAVPPTAIPPVVVTYTVTSPADVSVVHPATAGCATAAGQCTLRAAIETANAQPRGSTITIIIPAGTYVLTQGPLDLKANTIAVIGAGSAATTISGGGQSGVFIIDSGMATLSKLRITGGHTEETSFVADVGGGIQNNGNLTVSDSVIDGNSAVVGGGGIENTGILALSNSTVRHNTSDGISNFNGRMTLTRTVLRDNVGSGLTNMNGNVTIAQSRVIGNGGGINNAAYLQNLPGNLTVVDSTIMSNTATFGGGILNTNIIGTLTVIDSTIMGNRANDSGGGIFNQTGTLNLATSTVNDNVAHTSGGGIDNVGVINVVSSTISGNRATDGGGLYNWAPAAVRLTNNAAGTMTVRTSTLSGNTATRNGGGLDDADTVQECPAVVNFRCIGGVTLVNSTVSGNQALGGGGGIANTGDDTMGLSYVTMARNTSGLANTGSSTVILTGTVIANSTNGPNCRGSVGEALGYNLDSDRTCGFKRASDVHTTTPLLGPLANNGGPTQTIALLPGSPAIDYGGTRATGCPATDQRGMTRHQGDACDIGAYEARH